MPIKRYKPEQIVTMLRQIEVGIYKSDLLEARVIITTYNHHVRLLSPERSWLLGSHQSLLGYRSRHCHGINFTQNPVNGCNGDVTSACPDSHCEQNASLPTCDTGTETKRARREPGHGGRCCRGASIFCHQKQPGVVCLTAQWNVLDCSGVAVQNFFFWEPVDFLVSVIIDVGITDVDRTHVRVLN
jgi:hypothetical protein